MNSDDLRAALDYVGLSVAALAEVTGEDPALCRDWATGKTPAPRWLDCLMLCWCERPDLLQVALDDAANRFEDKDLLDARLPLIAAKPISVDLH